MPMGEFELISRFFSPEKVRSDVLLAGGDDCALLHVPTGKLVAVSTDTLVEHVHFLPSISPEALAYKSLAVNLSDLAAMGAAPAWVSLAISLPRVDLTWLEAFRARFFETLEAYQLSLIGGDTTRSETLSLTLTIQGLISPEQTMRRDAAKVGDWIFVSGTLGDSAAGLTLLLDSPDVLSSAQQYLIQRHLFPTPRVALGQAIAPYVRCAIDLSDGLLADLGHILKASQCGARVELAQIPYSPALRETASLHQAEQWALSGGEDYELCFTVSEANRAQVEAVAREISVLIHCIGQILSETEGLQLVRNGESVPFQGVRGFNHFAS